MSGCATVYMNLGNVDARARVLAAEKYVTTSVPELLSHNCTLVGDVDTIQELSNVLVAHATDALDGSSWKSLVG